MVTAQRTTDASDAEQGIRWGGQHAALRGPCSAVCRPAYVKRCRWQGRRRLKVRSAGAGGSRCLRGAAPLECERDAGAGRHIEQRYVERQRGLGPLTRYTARTTDKQEKSSRRLALTLALTALVFLVGFLVNIILLGG